MAWSQVNKSSSSTAASPGNTFTHPFGFTATAGNLLIVDVNAGALINSLSGSTGWTQACQALNYTDHKIYYKIAAGTENTVTANLSNTRHANIIVYEYSGNVASSPLDLASGTTGNSATPTTPSITTTDANDLVIVGFGSTAGAGEAPHTYSALTGTYTVEAYLASSGTGGDGPTALYGGSRILSATGSQSASATMAGGNNNIWMAVIAAFKMAAGGGGGPASKNNALLGNPFQRLHRGRIN